MTTVHPAAPSRVEAWERRAEWPLALLAAVFLAAYAWPILDTHLSDAWRVTAHVTDLVVWILFAVEYAVRLALATNRGRYWARHLHDLAIILLPVLRPLRLLRLVMLLRVLNRSATHSLRGRVIVYAVGASALLIVCAALAELDAERAVPHANIHGFGDALWWAATTVTTVGYGDHYPVTSEGRLIAVGLMVGGVALIGAVTASFASWLIDRVREVETDAQAPTIRDLHVLSAKIDRLIALQEAAAADRSPG
jgi:voltage-gated potassium channel